MEKNCKNEIQDVFLHVKLHAEDKHIHFQDDLNEQIKKNLLKIIDDIVQATHNFQRAENQIARSDKTQLWDIPSDDEVINLKNFFV